MNKVREIIFTFYLTLDRAIEKPKIISSLFRWLETGFLTKVLVLIPQIIAETRFLRWKKHCQQRAI